MERTHKIGTITFGVSLIACGAAFLIHLFAPGVPVWQVISFWPVVLILLGLEVLFSTFHKSEHTAPVYDKTGIILTALLVVFAMGMGLLSVIMEYVKFAENL